MTDLILCIISIVGAVLWVFFAFDRWQHKKNGWHKGADTCVLGRSQLKRAWRMFK